MRLLLLVILPVLLFCSENNVTNSPNGFLPSAGLLYQKSLGPTVIAGMTYTNKNMDLDDLLGIYGSVEVGQYGQAGNVGMRAGHLIVNSKITYSYLHVSRDNSFFEMGNYNGLIIEVNFLAVVNVRAGIYLGNADKPINFNLGVGVGFF